MNTKTNRLPDNTSTVCVYLVVENVEKEIEFLKTVFDAQLLEGYEMPDGKFMHAAVNINESTIMIGKSMNQYPPRESMSYIYVNDVDETYKKALDAGAVSMMEPADQFYGNRDAGVKSPEGNIWWIAQFLKNVSKEEIEQHFNKMSNKEC